MNAKTKNRRRFATVFGAGILSAAALLAVAPAAPAEARGWDGIGHVSQSLMGLGVPNVTAKVTNWTNDPVKVYDWQTKETKVLNFGDSYQTEHMGGSPETWISAQLIVTTKQGRFVFAGKSNQAFGGEPGSIYVKDVPGNRHSAGTAHSYMSVGDREWFYQKDNIQYFFDRTADGSAYDKTTMNYQLRIHEQPK